MTKSDSTNNATAPTCIADSGKIRFGAGWGLLPPKK